MTTYSIFRSRTFWSIIAMFLVGGVQAISSVVPAPVETIIMFILGFAATTFHLSTAVNAGATN